MTDDKPTSWSEATADEPWEEEHFTSEAIIEAVREARRIHRENPNLRQVINLNGRPVVFIDAAGVEEETEYAVFNDPELWEPLFASGELPESQRFQLDEPLHVGTSITMIVRFVDLRNLERARQEKIDKYGYLQVRTRMITRTTWRPLTPEEVEDARR